MASSAASDTSIANMALGHLGISAQIASLESERSKEANACRLFYETAIKATLRDFDWPFARVFADLALVEEEPNDAEEWSYSYRYPSDCVQFRRILSGSRNDSRQSRIPYTITQDSSGRLIFTDVEDARCCYTKYEDDTSRYTEDFILAASFRLAFYIAPSITAGDPYNLGGRSMKLYGMEIAAAESNASNEEQTDEPVESEYIRARDS